MKTNLRKYFITGLIALLPLAVVLLILAYIYRIIVGFVKLFPLFELPYGLGEVINLAVLFAFVLLVGFVVREIFKGYYKNLDGFFIRLPVIGTIYGSVRQVTNSLYGDRKSSFRRAVFVEYPRKGVYAIGFVVDEKNNIGKKEMVRVFVPSSPVPTNGVLIHLPKNEVIESNLSVEQAIKLIISSGIAGKEDKDNA